MTLRYSVMNQADALYLIARQFPEGVISGLKGLDALAVCMNMSVNVLRNKIRPTIDTHHCSDEETSQIMEFCQDAGVENALSPLIAKNYRHGLIAFPLPLAHASTDVVTMSLCNTIKEFGEVATSASSSLVDGLVTADEFADFERQALEAHAALHALTERMRARVQLGTK